MELFRFHFLNDFIPLIIIVFLVAPVQGAGDAFDRRLFTVYKRRQDVDELVDDRFHIRLLLVSRLHH